MSAKVYVVRCICVDCDIDDAFGGVKHYAWSATPKRPVPWTGRQRSAKRFTRNRARRLARSLGAAIAVRIVARKDGKDGER